MPDCQRIAISEAGPEALCFSETNPFIYLNEPRRYVVFDISLLRNKSQLPENVGLVQMGCFPSCLVKGRRESMIFHRVRGEME
ncbi:hypothetical protein TNCT_726441 [Trichonephila clavata]|uniref:Uncharacterized protein n=1 Tax=Trichonephila clavata TaxID=2740835 RepID=A0A8X6M1W1_TRICU|nr:hypothetical protein TNCT_726441 [Trichonephila clavata]